MTEADKKYRELQKKLLDGRASGELTEDNEDPILDAMDPLWWEMTWKERDKLNKEGKERILEEDKKALDRAQKQIEDSQKLIENIDKKYGLRKAAQAVVAALDSFRRNERVPIDDVSDTVEDLRQALASDKGQAVIEASVRLYKVDRDGWNPSLGPLLRPLGEAVRVYLETGEEKKDE